MTVQKLNVFTLFTMQVAFFSELLQIKNQLKKKSVLTHAKSCTAPDWAAACTSWAILSICRRQPVPVQAFRMYCKHSFSINLQFSYSTRFRNGRMEQLIHIVKHKLHSMHHRLVCNCSLCVDKRMIKSCSIRRKKKMVRATLVYDWSARQRRGSSDGFRKWKLQRYSSQDKISAIRNKE